MSRSALGHAPEREARGRKTKTGPCRFSRLASGRVWWQKRPKVLAWPQLWMLGGLTSVLPSGFMALIILCRLLRTCQTTRGPHAFVHPCGSLCPFPKGQGLGSSKLVFQVTRKGCNCTIICHSDSQPWLCLRVTKGTWAPPPSGPIPIDSESASLGRVRASAPQNSKGDCDM